MGRSWGRGELPRSGFVLAFGGEEHLVEVKMLGGGYAAAYANAGREQLREYMPKEGIC